jgi:16S rRNA (cytidine1402-2'-O)-methyltransferase
MNINTLGILYIVATPIGNVSDMTFRAVEVLKSVATIVAEDTRHSQPLLKHYDIRTPVSALHEHNEREFANKLVVRLKHGEAIALISDAGTPLISDPGYHLVNAAREAGIKVVPIPGACAAIAALSVSGLPTDSFTFEGFLPAKSQARQQQLEALTNETQTLIFYEAPHRILEMLQDVAKIFGPNRKVVIARELTKLFETILTGEISEVVAQVEKDPNQQRGEFVVMVAGTGQSTKDEDELKNILLLLLESLPLKKAVEIAAKISGHKKNAVYDLALTLKKDN